MNRESQRAALYEAEQRVRRMFDLAADGATVEIAGSTLTLPVEARFGTLDNVQTYVDKVLALNWVREAYPMADVRVTVRERRGQQFAHYERENATIAIPPRVIDWAWALRELVVLHELAHHLTPGAGHGPRFAATFVELVENIIGPEAGFVLRVMYADHGVTTRKETA